MTSLTRFSEAEMRHLMAKRIDLRSYSKIDGAKVFSCIAFQWSIIASALTGAILLDNWAAYLLAMLVVCSRQHALGIIMHDATHYRLLKNRYWNNLVSDIFCAFPIMMVTNRYRYYHLKHHKNINSEKDPYWAFFRDRDDWHWPKSGAKALSVFLRDLLGLTAQSEMPMILRWGPFVNHFGRSPEPPPLSRLERCSFYAFAATVLAFLWITGGWLQFLLLWFVPLAFIMMPLVRMRTIAEHLGIPGREEDDDSATRHVRGTWLERVFIAPCNINYHVAHHLFAAVPLYNLPALHKRLLQEAEYRSYLCHKDTYLGLDVETGVLGEVITRPALEPAALPRRVGYPR